MILIRDDGDPMILRHMKVFIEIYIGVLLPQIIRKLLIIAFLQYITIWTQPDNPSPRDLLPHWLGQLKRFAQADSGKELQIP